MGAAPILPGTVAGSVRSATLMEVAEPSKVRTTDADGAAEPSWVGKSDWRPDDYGFGLPA